jgi:7-cyano-7-deazaguanine synthase in queuosine biosynthesis
MTQLQTRFAPRQFNHLRANVGFDHHTVTSSGVEDTLRGRSFLFFSLAAMAASALGGDMTVHTPENGLISLNVPLDPLRLGALSTRTTHPFYVARFNELLRNLGLTIRLLNRYRHKTKGQMVAECQEPAFLRQYAKHTMSCSGPSKYRFHPDEAMRKLQHCGHCVPCLIRRASLLRGLGSDDTPYTLNDLRARVIDSDKAEGEHIRAFQLALARLSAKPARARLDIHQPGPLLDHPGDLAAYEGVYVEGMREVAELLDGVQAKPLS